MFLSLKTCFVHTELSWAIPYSVVEEPSSGIEETFLQDFLQILECSRKSWKCVSLVLDNV